MPKKSILLDRMVNTSDRTKKEVDFNQRFPTPFKENMKVATNQLGLDMAWTYGLIRQESRFVMKAQSSVGASGLMQVMPATAKYVAKKIVWPTIIMEKSTVSIPIYCWGRIT